MFHIENGKEDKNPQVNLSDYLLLLLHTQKLIFVYWSFAAGFIYKYYL